MWEKSERKKANIKGNVLFQNRICVSAGQFNCDVCSEFWREQTEVLHQLLSQPSKRNQSSIFMPLLLSRVMTTHINHRYINTNHHNGDSPNTVHRRASLLPITYWIFSQDTGCSRGSLLPTTCYTLFQDLECTWDSLLHTIYLLYSFCKSYAFARTRLLAAFFILLQTVYKQGFLLPTSSCILFQGWCEVPYCSILLTSNIVDE